MIGTTGVQHHKAELTFKTEHEQVVIDSVEGIIYYHMLIISQLSDLNSWSSSSPANHIEIKPN